MKNDLQMGIVPPQAIEFEEAILGACLLSKKAIFEVPYLKPEHFYKEKHREVFKAIKSLAMASTVDILTVTEELKKSGFKHEQNIPYYISTLTNRISSYANIDFHARIVVEKWMLRELINLNQSALMKLNRDDADCFDMIDYIYQTTTEIRNSIGESNEQDVTQIVSDFYEKLERIKNGEKSGIPSCLYEVTEYYGGYQPKLYILAARPSMGKSALMCNEVLRACRMGKSVVVHNMDMVNEDLLVRLASLIINEPYGEIQKGIIRNEVAFRAAMSEIMTFKLKIFTSNKLTDIILNTKMVAMTMGVDVVFVDYLQLARVSGVTRREEVASTSRELKALCTQMNIPVIALAQLSREVESNPNKIPMLSNLKESGDIEQDADVVTFIWRPQYYKIDYFDFGMGEESTENKAVLIVAKNKSGKVGDILVGWNGAENRFYDYINQ
jgi:replicative DNA helicase